MAEMKVRQVNMPSLKPRRSSIWRVNDVVKTLSKNLTVGGMEVCSVSNNNNEISTTTTQENDDELNFFNDIKREAEVLCMMEVRNHLMEYVNSHPSSTYEEWIGKLHPDNVNQKHPHLIDHRFYVEDSDHRRLWNINLTRGGGKRSYVHAKTGDDLSLRWDSLLSAESKEGEYAPLFYETLDIVEEDEDEHALLDVDVSNPFDLSLLEREQKEKQDRPKPNNIQRNTTLVTQAETVSINSNDDPNGTHHRNNNAAHDDDDDNDDHSISSYNPPDPLYNERTQVMSTVDSSNHSSVCSFTSKDKENDMEKPRRTSMSSENPYNHDYLHEKDHPDDDSTCDFFHHPHIYQPDPFDTVNQPDPFEDLGFDDDEDYGTTTTTHSNIIYPSSFPHDAHSSVADRKSSSQQDNSPSSNNKREKRSLHPPPIYNTIETRNHLMSYIDKHPKCTYEQWIGNLYPHVVSVNKTTQEVIIYDHEECFYDESSSFRVNWNINLAKGFGEEDDGIVGGGGRRLYVVSREYDDED
uniref:Uncharacterized protein n=1 Tax=Ditylum brightwellii TaxID=49249 RepID=A0A7S2A3Y3_9STRA|mmetsp:Transcript_8242/g.12315  ORF Transcript_8242/g.12315 Transcript_8242/m.12315 type:complete len:522 (+) Transcript_8242:130-1695(+)